MPETNLPASCIVIFGITGDLAKRKVLPAIYHLYKDGLIASDTPIIGTSRHELAVESFLEQIELCVLETDNGCDPDVLKLFRQNLQLLQFDPRSDESYTRLTKTLEQLEDDKGQCLNRLLYLSIPPNVFGELVTKLGEHRLNQSCQHGQAQTRLLVEKPFGYDFASASELIEITDRQFSEDQVFRIDHYLAKETAQNILAFRRYNPLFRKVWNADYIRRIDVLAAEKLDIEGRADFYDSVGALRDIVQSHLLQLLALVTMELPPDLNDTAALHAAKANLLQSIPPILVEQAKRAQYSGYRKEAQNPTTVTETFVSLRLNIDQPRWQGVTLNVTTGKALDQKLTTVTMWFSDQESGEENNRLTFRLQPNEGIDIELAAKKPGFGLELQTVNMDFSYQTSFDATGHPDAYERVLVDAIRGEQALFASKDEILASWRILEPVIAGWRQNKGELLDYEKGSAGPAAFAD